MTLQRLAALAEIRGETLESDALTRGAGLLDTWGSDRADEVVRLARSGELAEVAGIEPIVAHHAQEIATSGPLPILDAALRRVPKDLHRMIVSAGLPIETVVAMYRQLGITTRSELATAIRDRLLNEHVPAAARMARALRHAIDVPTSSERPEIGVQVGRACSIVEPLLEALRTNCPAALHVEAVGDLRRVEPIARELSILCSTHDPDCVISALLALPFVTDVLHRSRHKASVLVGETQVDLKVTPEDTYGLVQFWSTGNEDHLTQLVRHVGQAGLTLRSTGLFRAGHRVASRYLTDVDVYTALGLPFIAPELRLGTGEIEAAAAGDLPNLVTVGDIRGDLHVHSDWSDGRDTVEAMVVAARDLGYQYVAITDHSPSAQTTRSVDSGRLRRQADEIDRVRRQVPDVAVLHGVEVDILPDDSLDLDDATLERLDLVVASLHDPAGQTGSRLTERYLAAMRHPLVNIITHPTNRIIGYRAGYALNLDLLFTAAAATGTILEIDGAPIHLDMDGALARRAVAAGVTVSIDSDAHHAKRLERHMQLGVGTARRGWVEARHTANTWPLGEIKNLIARKRAGSRPVGT